MPIPPAERDSFIADWNSGLSYSDIEEKYDIPYDTIRFRVYHLGLQRRPPVNRIDSAPIDALIMAGAPNSEIGEKTGAKKSYIAHRRKVLGMQLAPSIPRRTKYSEEETADPPAEMKGRIKMNGRCPKCGGYVQHGGVRFGTSAPDISNCLLCGLTNESSGWWDAINNVWVEVL